MKLHVRVTAETMCDIYTFTLQTPEGLVVAQTDRDEDFGKVTKLMPEIHRVRLDALADQDRANGSDESEIIEAPVYSGSAEATFEVDDAVTELIKGFQPGKLSLLATIDQITGMNTQL